MTRLVQKTTVLTPTCHTGVFDPIRRPVGTVWRLRLHQQLQGLGPMPRRGAAGTWVAPLAPLVRREEVIRIQIT